MLKMLCPLVLLALCASPVQAQLVKPLQSVDVVDAKNQSLGKVFINPNFRPETMIVFKVKAAFVILPFTPDGFARTEDYVQWSNNDCTGTAWLYFDADPSAEPSMFAPAALVGPGNRLYVPVPGSVPQNVEVHSIQIKPVPDYPEYPNGCISDFVSGIITAWPAQLVGDLDTQFTPPFRLRGEELKAKK
jgi:hypothetical protein